MAVSCRKKVKEEGRDGGSNAAAFIPSDKCVVSKTHTNTKLRQPEAVDAFVRTFLFQMGMTQTLDLFQTEWSELEQKGLLKVQPADAVPDIYNDIQRLETKLKNARWERGEFLRDAPIAAETLAKAEKIRDYHRMHHYRVAQERDALFVERRKLRAQCDTFEPAILRMTDKCERLQRQTALLMSKRDSLGKAAAQGGSSGRTRQQSQVVRQKSKQ